MLTVPNHVIQVGKQFDTAIEKLHNQAKDMDLRQIATNSGKRGKFDFKHIYAGVGALLNGLYVTSRTAGNYLAGYNARSGTYLGKGITFDQFQRLAGAVQKLGGRPPTLKEVPGILADPYCCYPTYGEFEYQRRMSVEGWLHVP